ncbi:type VI secretion system baseplate subunit TssK [Legionella impletisoli]|uniref:Type VI secretion protein n=1 Tax=Legionella impletisoli TaxID=343510 RepID=A0A917JZ72_9GAMM|nr:type VI secretion system baseplate subunit TssK [Legionella impletisoli]GGI91829.1 type VI secretion protein [Legionella impletisoli]
MPSYRKVIWAEGTLLGQQHFQLWDRYQHHQQRLVQNYLHAYNWGIAVLTFDERFLPQGLFKVIRCVALLEDGRWIDFDDPLDEPLVVELPKEPLPTLDVYLALPTSETVTGVSGYSPPSHPTWQGDYQLVADQYDPNRKREVLLAKQHIYLKLDADRSDHELRIKIAELEYDTLQCTYKISHTYCPPLLRLGVSPFILSWIIEFKNALQRNIQQLTEQKLKHQDFTHGFDYRDFIYLNLTKTLTLHYAVFSEIQTAPSRHPYELYKACVALIGELWGYLDKPLSESLLPAYNQNRLQPLFSELNQRFHTVMKRLMPSNTWDVVLRKVSETHFESNELSESELNTKQFCLAFYHEEMTEVLLKKITSQVKIAAPSHIMNIVQSFTQGIEFQYLTSPAKQLMTKRHYHYFLLNKQSEFWDGVLSENKLAIFISPDLAFMPIEVISFPYKKD